MSLAGDQTTPLTGKKSYIPNVPSPSKPKVGMVFRTLDEAFIFYQKYAKLVGFTARKNTQNSVRGLVTKKYFVCSKEGFKRFHKIDTVNDEDGSAKKFKDRRMRPSKRTRCNARIKLRLTTDMKQYRIYEFVEEHNHDFVSQEDYHLLHASRKLSVVQEQLISDLSMMNIGPVKVFNIMRVRYGGFENVGVTAVDCKNFRRDLNTFISEYDADMAVRHLMEKKKFSPDFFCEYITGDGGSLAGLFWADEYMKINYLTFGDVISFDATYRTNRYDMVFVPFTGIDNHHRNVTFAGALLASETADSYIWLLQSFLKCFGTEPKVVVTDQDAAMKIAIKDVFPNSRHRLCMWHIMKKIADKVGIKLSHDPDFKEKFCGIVWTDSIEPDVFEKSWSEIMSEYSLNNNNWISDMFELRYNWIPAYYRREHLSGLMRTTSRSESENHFFGQLTNTKLTLVEFLTHFETAMESQRFTHRKNDHDTRYTTPDMCTNYELERQAEKIYTKSIFKDVQAEIHAAVNECVCMSYGPVDDFTKYLIKETGPAFSEPYEVMFRKPDLEVSCICKRFEQYGLLCRHIFYVLRMCGIKEFPEKYVLKRWTRDVVPNMSMRSMMHRDGGDDNVERVDSIIRDILFSNEYIVNRLVTDVDQLSSYRDQLKEMISKVDSAFVAKKALSKNDRFSNIVHGDPPSSVTIKRPTGIKNKGSGSHKRLKSYRELASVQKAKKGRACIICKKSGHNKRSCPTTREIVKDSSNVNQNATSDQAAGSRVS